MMDVEKQKSEAGKEFNSAFHNVTAMVGVGILALPYAMSQLGWIPGVILNLLSWSITLYKLWQMIMMHEMIPGKRMDRYHELGQEAFGEKLGLWIIVPQQLIVYVGCDILNMITGGQCLQKIHDMLYPGRPIRLSYLTLIFGSVQFFLSHLPNFSSITGISLAAAIMSLSYSFIAWGTSLHKGISPNVSYQPRASTSTGRMFQFLSGLGSVAFGLPWPQCCSGDPGNHAFTFAEADVERIIDRLHYRGAMLFSCCIHRLCLLWKRCP